MFDAGGAAPPFAAGALTLAGATGTGVDFYRRAARGYAQTNLRGPLTRIVPTAARRFDGRATPAGQGIPPPLPASKADEGASSALLCKTGCSARVGCRNSAARAQRRNTEETDVTRRMKKENGLMFFICALNALFQA